MATSNSTGTMIAGRSAVAQGGYQIAALIVTLAIAIVGGIITGMFMRFENVLCIIYACRSSDAHRIFGAS